MGEFVARRGLAEDGAGPVVTVGGCLGGGGVGGCFGVVVRVRVGGVC